jgi:hypothetical protein
MLLVATTQLLAWGIDPKAALTLQDSRRWIGSGLGRGGHPTRVGSNMATGRIVRDGSTHFLRRALRVNVGSSPRSTLVHEMAYSGAAVC